MVQQSMFLFLSVGAVSLFSFLAIAHWSQHQKEEREAYYKAESLRRLAELPGDNARQVIELMKDEERRKHRRKIEGMKLGGLINIGIGIGLGVLLYSLTGAEKDSPYLVGLIPALIGVSLLVYVYVLAPRTE